MPDAGTPCTPREPAIRDQDNVGVPKSHKRRCGRAFQAYPESAWPFIAYDNHITLVRSRGQGSLSLPVVPHQEPCRSLMFPHIFWYCSTFHNSPIGSKRAKEFLTPLQRDLSDLWGIDPDYKFIFHICSFSSSGRIFLPDTVGQSSRFFSRRLTTAGIPPDR